MSRRFYKVDKFLMPLVSSELFSRAPPVGYINKEKRIIYHGTKGTSEQSTYCSPLMSAKNTFTEHTLRTLRQISALNNDLIVLPADLTSLQSSFRTKNAFPHIQRLHNLVYAYGATVIEIVRRKEFGV
jgi:cyanate lyase